MMNKDELARCISHLRDRVYMSGVERDKLRIKQTSEIFTPTALVQEMLDQFPEEAFADPTKTFCDPAGCGDGQFLSEIIIRKLEHGSTLEQALSTTYGVESMMDNVMLCRERLLCGHEEYRYIVERNIVCANALTYDYEFKDPRPTAEELEMKIKYNLAW